MARKAFFSFHFKPDNWRASQVRNAGVLEGNSPVSDNDWEKITNQGDDAIKKWIAGQLARAVVRCCSCRNRYRESKVGQLRDRRGLEKGNGRRWRPHPRVKRRKSEPVNKRPQPLQRPLGRFDTDVVNCEVVRHPIHHKHLRLRPHQGEPFRLDGRGVHNQGEILANRQPTQFGKFS